MKAKLLVVLAAVMFVYCSIMVVSAQTTTSVWRDEMNYQSFNQLEAAGWTATHEDGISFSGGAIVLDGTSQDTAVHYSGHFSAGISDWKVEDKSRWTLGSHCGNSITAITNKHSYTFMADGWYGTFAFYRDGQKTTFDSFQESKDTWLTLAIEKQGNQISMYYNDELKSTYTEKDGAASELVGVDAVSPWKGGSEYDYFEVWQITDTSTQQAQESLLSNPIVIGGIIGVVGVGVGGVLYFFVLGGGGGAAGSASGGATGGVGGAGGSSGTSGDGSGAHPQFNPNNSSNPQGNSDSSNLGLDFEGDAQEHLYDGIDDNPGHHLGLDYEGDAQEHMYDGIEDQQSQNLGLDHDGDAQEHLQDETEQNPSENLGLDHDGDAQDHLQPDVVNANQNQQDVPERLKINSDTVTQQTQTMQEAVTNVVATPGQNTPQTSDKVLKPKTNANASTTDSS